MVSAFDSSHMQRVHQSLLEPGVCPICIMSKLADPLKQRKAAFWGASEEHKPSYRPRRSRTLISLSQIRAPAIPVLFLHSFYQDAETKKKGTDATDRKEYEPPAQMERVIHEWMNETFVFVTTRVSSAASVCGVFEIEY